MLIPTELACFGGQNPVRLASLKSLLVSILLQKVLSLLDLQVSAPSQYFIKKYTQVPAVLINFQVHQP